MKIIISDKFTLDSLDNQSLLKFFEDHSFYRTDEISMRYSIPVATLRVWKRRCGFKSPTTESTIKLASFKQQGIGGFHKKKNIPRDVPKEVWDNKEWFIEQYVKNRFGTSAIHLMTGLAKIMVEKRLELYGIPMRSLKESMKSTNPYHSKEWCYDMYENKCLTVAKMAKIASVSRYTITNWLAEFGMVVRDEKSTIKYYNRRKKLFKWKLRTDTLLINSTS